MRLTTLWQNHNRYLCMSFIVVLTSWAHRNMYVEHGQGYIENVLYWDTRPLGAKLLYECHTCSHFGEGFLMAYYWYISSSLSWAPANANKVKKSTNNMPLIDPSIHPQWKIVDDDFEVEQVNENIYVPFFCVGFKSTSIILEQINPNTTLNLSTSYDMFFSFSKLGKVVMWWAVDCNIHICWALV